ncbi:embryonic polarity protein dorsal-like isoform X4 [Bacillus rossius redtenbacheri]|uniref:embryonic polarity protein dorsal-like isoform X4 n=1 Tax=Bacillus rossius redtenbacheri TaxID=93214 RepID=UPI002FDCFB1C
MERLDVWPGQGMEHDDSGQPDLKLSDVIEVIETDQEQSSGVRGMYGGGGPGTAMDDARLRAASVKIVEQPASKALRFRYECEGRSAGSIPGKHSTPENKTFPSIQVVGYKGRALVVVSCVTKDPPYRPHPHNLVGKEGCKMGVCTLEINQETMAATFSNLGIQCVKKKDIEEALKTREEIGVDPFKTGFQHRSQTTSIDLNAVRLCFQVFLEGNHRGKFNYQLPPVVSEPIYDKKAMSDLVICRLSDCSCTVAGGREIILLCEKVAKEDIEIRFFEGNENKPVWEARGDFQPTNVHKQVAIAFRTPRYRTLETDAPVKAFVQLRRPSDGATSEPLPFEFLPLDSDPSKKRKRKYMTEVSEPNMLQQLHDADTSRQLFAGGGLSPSTNMMQVKKEPIEVMQMQLKYSSVGSSPSPQPSPSPHSQGRSPSPMDYRSMGAVPMFPPYRAQLPPASYGPSGELVLHSLPQASGGTMIHRSAAARPPGPYDLAPQYLHLPARPLPVGPVGPVGAPPRYALPRQLPDPNILDLDSQQITLDSGELASLVLLEGSLSESLSANLSISDAKPQPEQESMTDSLTRLTNNTLQEIDALNNLCRYREDH